MKSGLNQLYRMILQVWMVLMISRGLAIWSSMRGLIYAYLFTCLLADIECLYKDIVKQNILLKVSKKIISIIHKVLVELLLNDNRLSLLVYKVHFFRLDLTGGS